MSVGPCSSTQGRSDGGGYRYLYPPKSAQVNFLLGKMTSEWLFNSFIHPQKLLYPPKQISGYAPGSTISVLWHSSVPIVYLGALCLPPPPWRWKFFVLIIFNVKKTMLKFEHFWKCTHEMYAWALPFHISKYATVLYYLSQSAVSEEIKPISVAEIP